MSPLVGGGGWMSAIRQQINIAAPQRAVWNALTTSEGWRTWWAKEARLEPREGGRVVLVTTDQDGKDVEERGILHELRPTRKLEIAFDSNSPGPAKGTRLQFTISRDKDETRLALVHSGGGVLDDEAARDTLDKDWKNALRTLRSALEVSGS